MKTTISNIALATSALLTLSAGTTHAADAVGDGFDESRFYVSAFAGATINSNQDYRGLVGGTPQSVEVEYDTGYNIGAGIGYNFGEVRENVGLRGEIVLSYSESDIDEIFFSGNGPAAEINVDGDFSSTSLFANALFDLHGFSSDIFTPYVGGGIGIAFSNIDAIYGPGVTLDTNTEDFTAQAIIGVSAAATETVDLFVEGRYQRIFDVETPRFAPTGALTGVIEDDVDQFSVNFGLRFKL